MFDYKKLKSLIGKREKKGKELAKIEAKASKLKSEMEELDREIEEYFRKQIDK